MSLPTSRFATVDRSSWREREPPSIDHTIYQIFTSELHPKRRSQDDSEYKRESRSSSTLCLPQIIEEYTNRYMYVHTLANSGVQRPEEQEGMLRGNRVKDIEERSISRICLCKRLPVIRPAQGDSEHTR